MTEEEEKNHAVWGTGDMMTKLAVIRTIEAEKRTYLAELRTGIGVLAVPLSLLTILIATQRYYDPAEVIVFIIALVAGAILMSILGATLVYRSFNRLRTAEHDKKTVSMNTAWSMRDYPLTADAHK